MDTRQGLVAVTALLSTVVLASTLIPSIPPLSSLFQFNRSSILDQAIAELKATFPITQLGTEASLLEEFGTTWGSISPTTPPSIVVYALKTSDVVKVVNIATKYRIIVIPVAGRTSLEGQFACCSPPSSNSTWKGTTRPTIHLSFARMDKIIAIHEQDQHCIVEPGVGWMELNRTLASKGIKLFFPIDPAPNALFGGMAGVAGSGTQACYYGTMKGEWIQNMEVVLMNGQVLNTRGPISRARKSTTGLDVGRLFIGSEGTLGIITRLEVRLAPVLPSAVALTSFPSVDLAVQAAIDIIAAGLNPTSLEMLDGTSVRGLNLAKLLPEALEERPTVLMRFSSPVEKALEFALEKVKDIVIRNKADGLRVAKDEKENEEIWAARKNQFWSQQLLIGEGCRTLITDICVPLSRLAEFVERSEEDVKQSGLLAPIVAHIADGNIHRAILFKSEPGTDRAPPEVAALAASLSLLAIELEGTCAGEHGVGSTKIKYLEKELGIPTLDLMRRIKNELDPLGLLNPGKILYEI